VPTFSRSLREVGTGNVKHKCELPACTTEAVSSSNFCIEGRSLEIIGEINMASAKQKTAAKKNISKAATAAKKKRTIAHLPKSVRTALGKKGEAAARKKRKAA
jgi:hypothetical protein